MRPIRITGVTGNSVPVPLDVYTIGTANAIIETAGAAAQLQYTLDDPFTIAAGSLVWTNTAGTGRNAATAIPPGARAVQATGLVPADILVVSQQGVI